MPVRLTDTAIQKAARDVAGAGRKDLADAVCPGLRLRLTPAGGKTWVLACRDRQGRMRRFPLGGYPEMGISEARDAARALRAEVQKGADPIAERRRQRMQARDAKAGIGSLAAMLDLYGEKRGPELRSWRDNRKRVDLVLRPVLSRSLKSLTAAELQITVDQYRSAQSAGFVVRVVRPALKWAAQRGYCDAALAAIHPPASIKRRQRVLSRDELAALLPILRTSQRPYASAMRFMLLTLARRNEVCTARWRDIDLQAGTWTIPVTKNDQPHVVPLSRQAAELLRSRLPDQVERDDLVFCTTTGRGLHDWDAEGKLIQADSGTSGWHRHDLRRTGATMLGEMGELPDIVEAALNHTSIRSPLAATYNRSRYRPQVAAALQRLADALDGIENGSGQLVPLQRAAQ